MDHHEDESRGGSETPRKQDDEEAVARLEEMKKSIEAKVALRQSNLNPERPDSGFLRTLDSSIKRNTAVIKKLKQINEEQREGLMEDLRNVNLSKFVSEAVTSICDAKLRTSDIQAAVQICSLLHQRYKDFSPSLVQGLLKVFFPGKSGEDLDVDKNSKAMKKRSTLKLLLELYFVGVTEDSSIFINIIKDLTSTENLKDRDTTQTNLTLLASFARQGRVFLGLPLSGQETQEEFLKGLSITTDQKKVFRKAFHTYYDGVAELLQSEHASLRQMEHEDVKMFNAKGEPGDDNVSSYEKLRKSYDHLYRNVSSLAEALDMQPPVMPEDGHTTRVTSGEDASSSAAGKDTNALEALWDDEDTRAFYECLPDLRAFVPAVLLGEAEPKANEHSVKTQDQSSELATESDQGQPTQDMTEVSAESGTLQEGKGTEKGKDKEEKDKEKVKDPEKEKGKEKDPEKEKGKEKDAERKGENEKEKLKSLEGANLDALLQRLPGCVSRDLIDQLTVDFCYVNSKLSRKKLVRALFNVPRTSLELLAYYSRMVATLSTCMKDVSSMLLQMLEEEFNFLINKKDQMNIETKIRNIRFIGELCKFRIAPASTVFSCLKACLDDFTHHNIDVACNLLETCGRFLYRSPETAVRMARATTSSTDSSLSPQRLLGKVALVTGGATGIGESIARLFCKHGAKVCIADLQDNLGQNVCESLGGETNTCYIHCDVTIEDDVCQAVDFTVDKFGTLDIMVNNAGLGGPPCPDIRTATLSDFEKVFDVNVKGTFLGMKHAARIMIPLNKGSIVSLGSVSSALGGLGPHAYTGSKHAVLGLTRSVAAELGKHGIRVNCVSPYGVPTGLAVAHLPEDERTEGALIGFRSFIGRNANLQGVELTADDVANAVLFLASDEARYISGDNLMLDGGFTCTNHSLRVFR